MATKPPTRSIFHSLQNWVIMGVNLIFRAPWSTSLMGGIGLHGPLNIPPAASGDTTSWGKEYTFASLNKIQKRLRFNMSLAT